MKKVFFILLTICLYAVAFSQVQLTEKEKEDLIDQIKRKVVIFQDNEANLAGNIYGFDEKMDIYRGTLRLFIGEGDEYEMETPQGEITTHDPVTLKIFPSKVSKRKKTYWLKDYLTKRINNSTNSDFRYKKVVIETSDVILIDDIKEQGNGRFITTAHYMKVEKNSRTGEMNKITYEDRTTRTVKIYIESVQTYGKDGKIENRWVILLGDIDCDNVW